MIKYFNGVRIKESDVGSQTDGFQGKIPCKCIIMYPVPDRNFSVLKKFGFKFGIFFVKFFYLENMKFILVKSWNKIVYFKIFSA